MRIWRNAAAKGGRKEDYLWHMLTKIALLGKDSNAFRGFQGGVARHSAKIRGLACPEDRETEYHDLRRDRELHQVQIHRLRGRLPGRLLSGGTEHSGHRSRTSASTARCAWRNARSRRFSPKTMCLTDQRHFTAAECRAGQGLASPLSRRRTARRTLMSGRRSKRRRTCSKNEWHGCASDSSALRSHPRKSAGAPAPRAAAGAPSRRR